MATHLINVLRHFQSTSIENVVIFLYNDGTSIFLLGRVTMENVLDKVLTATEAAKLWNMAPITIRQACTGYSKAPAKFKSSEARKSGNTWLISVDGMKRVFGDRKNIE